MANTRRSLLASLPAVALGAAAPAVAAVAQDSTDERLEQALDADRRRLRAVPGSG